MRVLLLGRSFAKTREWKCIACNSMGIDVSYLLYMLLYNARLSERKIQKLVRIDIHHIYAMDFCIFLYNGLDDYSYR